MRPRDSQKNKVYKAEDVLKPKEPTLPEVKDVEGYLAKVMNSAWFRERYPECHWFKVTDGRRCRSASGWRSYRWRKSLLTKTESYVARLNMPRWCRYEELVLHELAHSLQPPESAAHGPEFCSILLELVRQYMGENAYETLWHSFRKHRVQMEPAKEYLTV